MNYLDDHIIEALHKYDLITMLPIIKKSYNEIINECVIKYKEIFQEQLNNIGYNSSDQLQNYQLFELDYALKHSSAMLGTNLVKQKYSKLINEKELS